MVTNDTLNSVEIAGFVASSLTYATGQALCSFVLETTEQWVDPSGEPRTRANPIGVQILGKLITTHSDNLKIGTYVRIRGYIRGEANGSMWVRTLAVEYPKTYSQGVREGLARAEMLVAQSPDKDAAMAEIVKTRGLYNGY